MQDVANIYSTGVGTEINYHNSEEWDKKFQTTMNSSSEYNKAINYRLRGDILEYKKILERVVLTGDGEAALVWQNFIWLVIKKKIISSNI
ncbi:MAG: hypothetical protein P8H57_03370 [Emcibacteraceae bacterium]|nr:hypothetical protein [Emcibacteraceae bacterium]